MYTPISAVSKLVPNGMKNAKKKISATKKKLCIALWAEYSLIKLTPSASQYWHSVVEGGRKNKSNYLKPNINLYELLCKYFLHPNK